MKDLAEASRLLGIDSNAPKDQIIKRYDVLLRKYKDSDEVDGVKLEDINNAYSLLMGYDVSDKPEMQPTEPPFFSKLIAKLFKLDAKKVENFLHYNKIKIILGIIGLFLVFSFVRSIVTNVETDFYFTSIGQIYIADSQKVQENIKGIIPNLQAPLVEQMYIGPNDQGEQAYAISMKITTLLAAGDMDLILLDKEKYESLAKEGAFETVDSIEKDLGSSIARDDSLMIKPNEGESAIFGVDVTNSQFLKENGVKGEKIIAAIRINAKHKAEALQIYRLIYESLKK